MILQIGLVILGMALIVAGAHFLTDGASAIAVRLRIPQLIVGLTIVAFGTSAPELIVSIIGSIEHNGGIAVGNVIGSNIFNGLAILGITALITPLDVERSLNRFDIPFSILAAIVLALMISDPLFDGMPSALYRSEAFILVLLGLIFLSYRMYIGKKVSKSLRASEQAEIEETKQRHSMLNVLFVIIGIVGLVVGGDLFVENASNIASKLGISDTIIGLTLVSWGTSLPELVTSIIAVLKKSSGIAIGNVVGSNIFNILFVLGISGMINPLTHLQFTDVDVFMQLLTSIVIFAVAIFFGEQKITRAEGAGMLILFVCYNLHIIHQALLS